MKHKHTGASVGRCRCGPTLGASSGCRGTRRTRPQTAARSPELFESVGVCWSAVILSSGFCKRVCGRREPCRAQNRRGLAYA
jgi:hypothetical protein